MALGIRVAYVPGTWPAEAGRADPSSVQRSQPSSLPPRVRRWPARALGTGSRRGKSEAWSVVFRLQQLRDEVSPLSILPRV